MKVYEYMIMPKSLKKRVHRVKKMREFCGFCYIDVGFCIDSFNQFLGNHDKIFLSFRELNREESLKLFLRSKR